MEGLDDRQRDPKEIYGDRRCRYRKNTQRSMGKTERSMGNRIRDGKSETGNEKYNVNTGRFMGKSMGDRGKIQRVS
jgi:hypothetical protein